MDVELKYIKSLPEETTGQLNDREKNKETFLLFLIVYTHFGAFIHVVDVTCM
jgi:hypothetical protein